MRGQGFPDMRGYGEGDQIVSILVEIPKKLSKDQENLYRELAKIEESNVTPERKSFLNMLKDYFND